MTGNTLVRLQEFLDEAGEKTVKEVLSGFLCPLNPDVELFLRNKAIDFAKQGIAQTHLVFAPYKGKPVLVGYFTFANKFIVFRNVSAVSRTTFRRLSKFARFEPGIKALCMSLPLLAQLGKNYANEYCKLISGAELLDMAITKVSQIQMDLGGRFVYLECEDKPKLLEFYSKYGFCEFDHRPLDPDESDTLSGEYLVQMIKYIH
jgi:thiol-disulfide isomerase/thioredoxin